MTQLVHRGAGPFNEMFEWLENVSPFRGTWAESYIPVEEFVRDDRYVVRADLPGIDPAKDVEVTIQDDMLTIHGERHEEQHAKHHSEMRYGSFTRQLRLPKGSTGEGVSATYTAGVLEVTLPMPKSQTETISIPVARNGD